MSQLFPEERNRTASSVISLKIKAVLHWFSKPNLSLRIFFLYLIINYNIYCETNAKARVTFRKVMWIKYWKKNQRLQVSFPRTLFLHWIQYLSFSTQNCKNGKGLKLAKNWPTFSIFFNMDNFSCIKYRVSFFRLKRAKLAWQCPFKYQNSFLRKNKIFSL